MDIKLIVSDIDNTILRTDGTLSPRNHDAEQNDQSKNHGARHDQAKTFLEIIIGIHSYDSLKKSSSITTFRNRSRNSAIRAISRSYDSESP